MNWRALLLSLTILPAVGWSQLAATGSNPVDASVDKDPYRYSLDAPQPQLAQNNLPGPGSPTQKALTPAGGIPLSLKDAEALALKNNPQVSVGRLNALAAHQITREVRSAFYPNAAGNITAVGSLDNSRITAGGLNNPIVYERIAGGASVSQLLTDFGHTKNLAASAAYQERAENQNAIATSQQVLLAVDQAFYNVLQGNAVLHVAEQTVTARQTLVDQISALTKSK